MLIVCSAPTSGCVKAGLNVLVPADCCADRAQARHDANLCEKYADVTDADDVASCLETL